MKSTNRAGQPWVKPGDDTNMVGAIGKRSGDGVGEGHLQALATRRHA
jgi:hypothetical protein